MNWQMEKVKSEISDFPENLLDFITRLALIIQMKKGK